MPQVLVTSYVSPDLDGFACAIAYTELLNKLGKEATAAIYGTPHDEALFLIKRLNLNVNYSSIDPTDQKVILVDMSELSGKDERINPANVIEIIDHRRSNDAHAFVNAKTQIEFVGSAATLIAERFQRQKIEPSRTAAVLLHSAIISNTLNFKAKVTADRDRSMNNWLVEFSQLPKDFAHDLFAAKSDLDGDKLGARLKSEHAVFTRSGKRMDIIQLEIVDGLNFLNSRGDEIKQNLSTYKKENGVDFIFLTLIDLEAYRNIFFTPDSDTQKLLSATLGVSFENDQAIRPEFIMRKELVPLLEVKITEGS